MRCDNIPLFCCLLAFSRSESLIPEECSVEELESGEMKAICTSEGKEYIYRVSSALLFSSESATSEAARFVMWYTFPMI